MSLVSLESRHRASREDLGWQGVLVVALFPGPQPKGQRSWLTVPRWPLDLRRLRGGGGAKLSAPTHTCAHTHMYRDCAHRDRYAHTHADTYVRTRRRVMCGDTRVNARARTRAAAGAPGWWKSWLLDINLWQLEGLWKAPGLRPDLPSSQGDLPPLPVAPASAWVSIPASLPRAFFLGLGLGRPRRTSACRGLGRLLIPGAPPPSPLPARQEAARCRLSRTPGP